MTAVEFTPWPKIARFNREIIITEKINGTNAAVQIVPLNQVDHIEHQDGEIQFFNDDKHVALVDDGEHMPHVVYAQSRTRFITPGNDNFGFAKWVADNAKALVETLGEGTHFGEWWGSGIQNSYGLPKGERRFSLFNTTRWGLDLHWQYDKSPVPGLRIVPVLYRGLLDQSEVDEALYQLEEDGSFASPGFEDPEGVVIFHTASNTLYKVTLKGDEAPKGPEAHAQDEEKPQPDDTADFEDWARIAAEARGKE
jgi:hypothetical protein